MLKGTFVRHAAMATILAASSAALMAADSTGTNTKSTLVGKDLFADSVVARGAGFEIKRSQLDEEVIRVKAQLASQGQPVPPERNVLLQQGILEQMIALELMTRRATDADKTAGKEMADKRIQEAQTRLGSEEAMNMRLKAENLTLQQLKDKWTQAATAEAVVKREIPATVSDAEAKKYYDDNPGKFEQPEMVRASHILLATRDRNQKELGEAEKAAKKKQAEELLKRAKAGEDFEKLKEEFSEDPGKKINPEYTFPRGRMVPEFEAAAFSLPAGQTSDVVTTQFGYHIIKVHEKIAPKKVELEKVLAQLKEGLAGQEIQKQIPAYLKKLKTENKVEVLDAKLVPAEPAPGSMAPGSLLGAPATAK